MWTVARTRPVELAAASKVQHWRHGWIPVDAYAKRIADARKQAGLGPGTTMPKIKPNAPSAPKGLSVADALKDKDRLLPPALRVNAPFRGKTDEQWHADIVDYLKQHPGGFAEAQKAASAPSAPSVPNKPSVPKKATPKTRSRAAAPTSPAPGSDSAPPTRAQLTKQWKTSTTVRGGLTSDENRAIDLWQNGYAEDPNGAAGEEIGHYISLNNMLRGTGDLSALDEESLMELDEIQNGLATALAKSKAAKDMTVWRGVTNMPDVKVGDTFSDDGWQSTTLDKSVAQTFMQGEGPGGIIGGRVKSSARLLSIRVRKGDPLLRVDDPTKHELVIGPGTPFRVVSIEGNMIVVERAA